MGKFLIIFVPTHSEQCAQCSEKECKPEGWGSYYYYTSTTSKTSTSHVLSLCQSPSIVSWVEKLESAVLNAAYVYVSNNAKGMLIIVCIPLCICEQGELFTVCEGIIVEAENYSVHLPCLAMQCNLGYIIRTLLYVKKSPASRVISRSLHAELTIPVFYGLCIYGWLRCSFLACT